MSIRFLDPIFFGRYPQAMENLVGERLPEISPEMSEFLKGSLDFVGLNHYTTLYVRNDRMNIRKLILQDASSDAAVITSGMILKTAVQSLLVLLFFPKLKHSFDITRCLLIFYSAFILAFRAGVAIGERVCSCQTFMPSNLVQPT